MTKKELVKAMMDMGYTTGHGDGVVDLLQELEWQVAEREREACAKVAESYEPTCDSCPRGLATAIRSRGIDGATVGEVGVWGHKREWVGLKPQEIGQIWANHKEVYGFGIELEQVLKERNT